MHTAWIQHVKEKKKNDLLWLMRHHLYVYIYQQYNAEHSSQAILHLKGKKAINKKNLQMHTRTNKQIK